MLNNSIRKELTNIVGKENVSFLAEDTLCYSYDATGEKNMPEAVIFPCDASEVSKVMRLANANGFAVVPRGAGSGFTGGSLPVNGGVVLTTERMGEIEIDPDNMVAFVGSGVVLGELQDEVEKHGLFYPPDPTSLKFSSIGGNICEGSGGPRAIKYGTTRDYVLGLELVLPTGEVLNTGVRTMKGVVGYDLARLMVGSEGTLGVVTKATLKLIPLPEFTRTMYVTYASLEDAAKSVSRIISSKVVPS
ncbi:MAG: FAD-binding oxidoreductase, partial [Deltaproteobacteria bacterium]|nr:FAD-binding oxidoreductase [Deltaproteobacteria bacterium]